MSKHTPGPWVMDGPIFCGNGTSADIEGYSVARIMQKNRFSSCIPDSQMEANARLIAAAPELLGACKTTLNHFISVMEGHCPPGSPEEEAVDLVAGMLRFAIAKAEGT